MDILRASDIREILKVTQNSDIISLAGGLPAPELFPVEAIADLASEVLRTSGLMALQYSPTEGIPALRAHIAKRMNDVWKTSLASEEILVTTGSQQGVDLVAKLFLNDGDTVLCESPSYLGAIQSFNTFRPNYLEIQTDEAGMVPEALEENLRLHPKAKFIYIVPTFQNPSGRTWTLERRRQLIGIAARYDIVVVEDNPYGELWYDSPPPAAIQALDTTGNVISLGTFSKIFCPGLRLGWVAAQRVWLDKLVVLKQGADLHTSTLDQMITAAYLERYDLDADLEKKRYTYRQRRDAMIEAIGRYMPEAISITRPGGGLFLWVTLPGNADTRALLERSLQRGVAFVPGEAFFPATHKKNSMRLNFSNMPEARITEGIRRLGLALQEMESGAPIAGMEHHDSQ